MSAMATKSTKAGQGESLAPKRTKAEMTKEEKRERNAEIIRAAVSAMSLKPLNPKDVKGVSERISIYFNSCADRGARPSLPGLCNVLGIDKQIWKRWIGGEEGKELAYMASRTMGALEAIWADLSMDGALNPASGIFGAKNWYGYKDTPEEPNVGGVIPDANLDELIADAKLLPEYTIVQDAQDTTDRPLPEAESYAGDDAEPQDAQEPL